MRILSYKTEYEKEVQKLIKTVLFEIFGKHKVPEFENFEEYSLFHIVQHKNKIIASIALKTDNNTGTIKRLYVDKDYRNKGIAQKLYDRIEKYAKKNKISRLELSTTPQMVNAINFYKKNGFKKTSENKKTNQIFFKKVLK